jgi:hypothetical protein
LLLQTVLRWVQGEQEADGSEHSWPSRNGCLVATRERSCKCLKESNRVGCGWWAGHSSLAWPAQVGRTALAGPRDVAQPHQQLNATITVGCRLSTVGPRRAGLYLYLQCQGYKFLGEVMGDGATRADGQRGPDLSEVPIWSGPTKLGRRGEPNR